MNITTYEGLAAYAAAAARLLKCNVEDLLAFRWSADDQQFIVLAPTGAKHRFDVDQLEAAMSPPADVGVLRNRDSPAPDAPALPAPTDELPPPTNVGDPAARKRRRRVTKVKE